MGPQVQILNKVIKTWGCIDNIALEFMSGTLFLIFIQAMDVFDGVSRVFQLHGILV